MASNYVNMQSIKKGVPPSPPIGSIFSPGGRSVTPSTSFVQENAAKNRNKLKTELLSTKNGSTSLRKAADIIKKKSTSLSQPVTVRNSSSNNSKSFSQSSFDISSILGDSPISNNTKLGKRTKETLECLAKISTAYEIPAKFKDSSILKKAYAMKNAKCTTDLSKKKKVKFDLNTSAQLKSIWADSRKKCDKTYIDSTSVWNSSSENFFGSTLNRVSKNSVFFKKVVGENPHLPLQQ